ncbi:MAG: hypothetical protein WC415_05640 [Patescibacteria group bacterium]|jgi:hypothetical protein
MPELKIANNFETPKTPESSIEKAPARPDFNLEKTKEGIEKEVSDISAINTPSSSAPVVSVSLYEERRQEIEKKLAHGLDDIYLSLSPEKRAEFRKAGEETAIKINKLLEKTKVNLSKIVNLIRKWLSVLPGVNKLFLEQEAKIRADEIVKMKK